MQLSFVLALAALANGDAPPATPAQGRPAAFSVTFDEALGLAFAAPAVLGANEAAAAHRRVASRISSLVANPQLTVQPGLRPSPRPGEDRFEWQTSLSQAWNLAGLPGARREAARREGDVLAAEARAAALSHRLLSAQAWIDLWAAEQALTDARQESEMAADLADRVSRAAAVAALTRADAAEADAYRAEAALQALSLEGDATDLGFQLARQMGRSTPKPLHAEGTLPRPELPPRPDYAALLRHAETLPAVAARRIAADAERARAAEVRAARGTQLSLGLVGQRDNLGGTAGFLAVGVTLPLFDRGEREAAPLAASAARLDGESAEAVAQAATELARALHEVEHTREVLSLTEQSLLPAAVESSRLREAALRAGDTTVLEVLVTRRAAYAARIRWARASAAHAWASVKAWLLLSDLPGAAPSLTGGDS